MQVDARALMLSAFLAAVCAAPLAAAEGRGGGERGPGMGNRWGADILIEPNLDLSKPKPNPDKPEFVMAELQRCVTAGVTTFVDCLRQNHGSIMIRRLEACVRSETIPDDPGRVEACIPLVPQP
jgi:hypothetical protein